jgi:hypothetical protein
MANEGVEVFSDPNNPYNNTMLSFAFFNIVELIPEKTFFIMWLCAPSPRFLSPAIHSS